MLPLDLDIVNLLIYPYMDSFKKHLMRDEHLQDWQTVRIKKKVVQNCILSWSTFIFQEDKENKI